MFDIALDRRGRESDAMGEIVIDAHRESFLADLSYWTADDYRASWLRTAAHVLEHGHGRFLVSVNAPGQSPYLAFVVRVRGDEAIVFKSFLLTSLTDAFAQPEDGEVMREDYAERGNDEPRLGVHRCPLRHIADFEVRLRGAATH
jgi:hypothetical protein